MPEMPSSPRTIDFYFKTVINNLLLLFIFLLLPLGCPQEWCALQESCESKELGWDLNDVPVSAGVRRKPSGLSALENALPSAASGRKKEIFCVLGCWERSCSGKAGGGESWAEKASKGREESFQKSQKNQNWGQAQGRRGWWGRMGTRRR